MKSSKGSLCIVVTFLIAVCLAFGVGERQAEAVPSYARQTGLRCSGCHYTPPELNPAGRAIQAPGLRGPGQGRGRDQGRTRHVAGRTRPPQDASALGDVRRQLHPDEEGAAGRTERDGRVSTGGLAVSGRRLDRAPRELRADHLQLGRRPLQLGQHGHPLRAAHVQSAARSSSGASTSTTAPRWKTSGTRRRPGAIRGSRARRRPRPPRLRCLPAAWPRTSEDSAVT